MPLRFPASSALPYLLQRLVLAVGGGYLLAAGWSALSARLLTLAIPPAEAAVLAAMPAFLVYLALLVWAFAERSLSRLWLVFGGGAVAVFGLPRLTGALGVL